MGFSLEWELLVFKTLRQENWLDTTSKTKQNKKSYRSKHFDKYKGEGGSKKEEEGGGGRRKRRKEEKEEEKEEPGIVLYTCSPAQPWGRAETGGSPGQSY